MVEINKITEPISELYFNGELIGEISSSLQLNDCLLQIKRENLGGYSLKYEERLYDIQPNGRIKSGGLVYPLLSKQMQEILGF